MQVVIDGGSIVAVERIQDVASAVTVVDLPDHALAPGLVDLQVNGGADHVFERADDTEAAEIVAAHARLGTTTLLATMITSAEAALDAFITRGLGLVANTSNAYGGIHLEGPHISRTHHGAHPRESVRAITHADLVKYEQIAAQVPLLITLAPETVPPAIIRKLVASGAHVSLGHSGCTLEQAAESIAAGATTFTHLFNGMSGVAARHAGLAGAAILSGLPCGLIYDGAHVGRHSAELAIRAGAEIYFVSDCLAPPGGRGIPFEFGGHRYTSVGGACYTEDGRLGGASKSLWEVVDFAIADGLMTMDQAIRCATSVPADVMGLSAGRIASGRRADLIAIRERDRRLSAVWLDGKVQIGASIDVRMDG